MDADRVKLSLISRINKFIVALASVLMFASSLLAQPGTAQIEGMVEVAEGESPLERKTAKAARSTRLDWWNKEVVQSVTESDRWVSFDLETILLDTLENSPRIESVSKRTSIAFEQIVQQDAMFDPNVLFESNVGRNNEPIGNELTTGGPPRLIEGTTLARAGVQKSGRRGTLLDLSQEIGTFNSNSKFVSPVDFPRCFDTGVNGRNKTAGSASLRGKRTTLARGAVGSTKAARGVTSFGSNADAGSVPVIGKRFAARPSCNFGSLNGGAAIG